MAYHKHKHRCFYNKNVHRHISQRYHDEKKVDRFGLCGAGFGFLVGLAAGGVFAGILGLVAGLIFGAVIGRIIVIFQ